MSNNLDLLLEDTEIQAEAAQKILNTLKMLMYLYSNIIILSENMARRKEKDLSLISNKKGRKNAKNDNSYDDNLDKYNILRNLSEILQKPINKLWDPPICEESFLKIIGDVLFTFLEDPALKNDHDLQSFIFNVFGNMLKNYNYNFSFRIRIVQLIKDKENEHLTAIVPEGIKMLVEEYNCKGLVRELVRELTEWQTEEIIQDAPGTKHCSSILVNMTVLMPELMIPEVIYLIKYLNHDSYTLRICVLTIITEVILNVLSKEELSEEAKESRAYFFQQLEMHMLDTNAHVRAKVLQLWSKLHFDAAVPRGMLSVVMEKAVKKLQDRAVLVRKYAANLLTTFIECNPFSATVRIKSNKLKIRF